MSPCIVRSLPSDQVLAVYPLVRESVPELDSAAWVRFARHLLSPKRAGQAGIIAAWRPGRSFPGGLVCYRVDNDLLRGRVLVAEHFVAVDLLDPQAVLTALVAELESLAARLDCNAVRSVLHGGNSQVRSGLSAAGHQPEGALLLKPLGNHPSHCAQGAQAHASAHHY